MSSALVSDNHRITAFEKLRLPAMCFLYLACFGIAEYLRNSVSALAAVIVHFGVLLSLIIIASLCADRERARLWMALGIVPLSGILGLIIPIADITETYWYLIVSIPLFAVVLLLMRSFNYSFSDIGFNGKDGVMQGFIAVSGFILGCLGYFFLQSEPLIGRLNVFTALFPGLVLLVTTGLVNEIAYRGVMQRAAQALGRYGWIFVALVYAASQVGRGTPLFSLYVLPVSLYFSWMAKETGSITGVCLAHGLFNIGVFLVLPYVFV